MIVARKCNELGFDRSSVRPSTTRLAGGGGTGQNTGMVILQPGQSVQGEIRREIFSLTAESSPRQVGDPM
jgi:hypothetical protein